MMELEKPRNGQLVYMRINSFNRKHIPVYKLSESYSSGECIGSFCGCEFELSGKLMLGESKCECVGCRWVRKRNESNKTRAEQIVHTRSK